MLHSIKFYKYRPFAVHFILTVVVATVCLGYLDGRTFNANSRQPQYREVDGSLSYATSYALLQSDITTAVSLAASVTRVAGGWWATGYIWRCIFVAMERGGISAKGVSQAISNRPPAHRHFTRKSSMIIIYINLFATFAIDYFSAALTGSFIWENADNRIPGKMPLGGITDGIQVIQQATISESEESADHLAGDTYQSQIMTMASASASIAWGTPRSNSTLNITEPSTTLRRVINGAQYISTNSTLANITMPYIALDAFEWVRDPIMTHQQLSLLDQNFFEINPFRNRANLTGGPLPDYWGWGLGTSGAPVTGAGGMAASDKTEDEGLLQRRFNHNILPISGDMPISETRLFAFRIWFPWSRLTDTEMAPPCPQNFMIDPGLEISFISGANYTDGRDCFAIANVSYRAGVISCQNCTIISPNVVEAHVQASESSSITGTFYASAALALVPLITTTFFLSNYAIPLNYGTRRQFAIELTSRAYQAGWAALVELDTIGTSATTVQIALPTLRAKVIHWRVYLWVALHLWVLALGLLFIYVQSHCNHPWVEDPTMAIFWLDTRAVLTDSEGRHVSDPWQPGTEVREDGMLTLEHNFEAGQRSVQVKRSSGSRQRRYSN